MTLASQSYASDSFTVLPPTSPLPPYPDGDSEHTVSLAQRLTDLYLEYHKAVVLQVTKERGSPPRRYKGLEFGNLKRFFDGIRNEGQSLLEQGARLLSGLIVTHALPNTNHRTSLFFVQAFLEANGVRFPHYRARRDADRRFRLDGTEYIRDSKYLLNLKVDQDKYAGRYAAGKPIMYLRGGGRRRIRPEDLGLSNRQYNTRHREMTRTWLERMLGNQSGRYLKTAEDSLNNLIAQSER